MKTQNQQREEIHEVFTPTNLHHTFGFPFLLLWKNMVISLMLFITWKPSIENQEKLVVLMKNWKKDLFMNGSHQEESSYHIWKKL